MHLTNAVFERLSARSGRSEAEEGLYESRLPVLGHSRL